MKRAVLIALLLAAAPAPLLAQDGGARGVVAFTTASSDDSTPARDRSLLLDAARAAIAPITDVPALVQPIGHTAEVAFRNRPPPPGMPARDPMTARGQIVTRALDLSKAPDASGAYPGRDEGAPVIVFVNDPTALFIDGSNFEDVSDHHFSLPRDVQTASDGQVIPQGLWDVHVFSRAGRSPIIPVTQAERLERLIKEAEAELDGNRAVPQLADLYGGWVQARRRTLDALSAGERTAQACDAAIVDPDTAFGPCLPGDPGFVRINPDYFDRSLPRSTIQLLTIAVPNEDHARSEPTARIIRDVILQADLQAVRKHVH